MLKTFPGRRVWCLAAAAALISGAPAARGQELASFVANSTTQDGEAHVLELSLAETVELVLRHNLQVRIAALNPDLAEEQIRSARSRFDPVMVFNLPQAFNRSTQPQSSVLGGADVLTQERIVSGFQFNANTQWGLGWSLSGSVSRSVSNSEFSTFNPQWDTSLNLQLRQPLLRNLGDANKQQLLVAQNDFSVSREQFRFQLQNSVFTVIQAYWNLVSSYRSTQIATDSLALAEQQHRDNTTRVRIGALAAVDVIQTQQQVADAELTLLQAELALSNQQDLMRSLLNLDAVVAVGWEAEIIPTDLPAVEAVEIDIDRAVIEALEKSPTIRQNRINLDSRQIDLRASKNQLKPQLDFIGNATLSGLGGDQLFRSGDIFGTSGISEIQSGGVSDAFQQMFSGDFRNWTVGLQLSIPIRNDFAEAQHAQATIRERQATTQVRDDELQIRLRVRNAARNVTGGVQQVEAAANAVLLAERQYAAELRRFENGTSSTFQVLSLQRQLTGARQRELFATINLNVALANLDLNKGTLLEQYGVDVDDAGVGGPPMRARDAGRAQAGAAAGPPGGQ
jgi:outer membrane protein TolC